VLHEEAVGGDQDHGLPGIPVEESVALAFGDPQIGGRVAKTPSSAACCYIRQLPVAATDPR
jgi:hypothetical protein